MHNTSRVVNTDVLPAWRAISENIYATTELKAAAEFKRFADEKVVKIFKRIFTQYYRPPLGPLPSFLDEHQVEGVDHVLTRSRSYLAHAPGAGKTCQAIIASHFAQGTGQNIFIVPPYLTMNWEREIVMWKMRAGNDNWQEVQTVPKSEHKEAMGWGAEHIVVPDSMLSKPWVLTELEKLKTKVVAVDEASRFKEVSSQRTVALFGGQYKYEKEKIHSRGFIKDARHAVLLDGSPMPNRPVELWAPTFALSPESIDCMEYERFGLRYGGATPNWAGGWDFKHSSHEAELKERLQKNFMHVVPESRLGHPERLRKMIFINEDVRTPEIKDWEVKNLSRLDLTNISEDESQGQLARMRRELGIRKIKWVAGYVRERLRENADAILLFAWHRDVCLGLRDLLCEYKPLLVMGGGSTKDREKAFHEFQLGKRSLIIGNIAAMGRGHNLQKASRVVFAEFSWTDENNKQCEKRASRKGSTFARIPCDYIVAPHSLDEKTLRSVFRKISTQQKVIGA